MILGQVVSEKSLTEIFVREKEKWTNKGTVKHMWLILYYTVQLVITKYYIVILRWPVGSRMLHQSTTVIRRVTTVRTERGVRLTVCQGDVS